MKPGFSLFLLFVFLIGFTVADASPEDTAKKEIDFPTVIQYIHGNTFSSQAVSFHALDTTLDQLEIINPAIKNHYNYLSNIGSAAAPQEFQLPNDIYTDAGFHSYNLYLINDEKIRYFKTNKAFTELNYHLSSGKEQQITVALSQNILKNWNIGLDFNRLGSTGFLKNGATFHTNVDLYTWYHSKNNRYNLLAFAYWNTITNKVNGGLHNDSIFDNSSVSNLSLQGLLVNLTDAENRFSNRKFRLQQFLDLHFHATDDPSDTSKKTHSQTSGRLEHSISFEARTFTYRDTKPESYYKNSYFGISSLDSLHYYDLRNRFAFSSLLCRKDYYNWFIRNLQYSIGVDYQWMRYKQYSNENLLFEDAIMQNVSLNGSLENQEEGTPLYWKVTADYIFAGENKGNYKGEVLLHAPLNKYGALDFSGTVLLKSPELIYQNYTSNHFIWENNFEKSEVKNIRIAYSYPEVHLSLGIEVMSVSNFIIPDSSCTPVQESGETSVTNYSLIKDFKYRKFHLNNSFVIQKVNRENALHVPSLIATQSLFYESFLYKSALLLRVGFDFHFNSLYYADGFMPATGLFNRQYEAKTGGFPLTDFFFSFRIKTASMFVKLENITDIFTKKGYYLTPHYPMQGMTFQFGIRWRFFDK